MRQPVAGRRVDVAYLEADATLSSSKNGASLVCLIVASTTSKNARMVITRTTMYLIGCLLLGSYRGFSVVILPHGF